MLYWLAILTELTYILANINNINESFLSLVLESNTNLMFNSELCDTFILAFSSQKTDPRHTTSLN